ncbi:VirB4-like conjugal transfer ATPase, CD1110 family [Candidatus Stoquefichus massiliensis]|uniref:VirB4-like conjugal transfer ATPase, CD1110 family n=1 Tax=Candidatus Stoquefichus massiliensis TaxID=1470350 RepID=UPI000489466B|nr:ATP-binding protein [Candidatus Stoquefichus massiliensis]
MIKSYEKIRKQNKETFKVPKSAQDVVDAEVIYKDGIFKIGNKFTKTYKFKDINYSISSKDEQIGIFLNYSELLNSLDSSTMTKITINNRKVDLKEFKKDILIPYRGDYLDKYRKEYNEMLLEKVSGIDGIIQEKYITVTVYKKEIEDARNFFARTTLELSSHFTKLGSSCEELNAIERLKILHDFYRSGEEELFQFDLQDFSRKGHDFKDVICPRTPEFHHKYFKIGDKYGRVLYLANYARYISDDFVSKLCDMNKTLMYSMDIISVPTDEAVKEVENRLLGVETNITNWQRRQNANNNFSAVIPYDMETQRKEAKEFLDDLTVRDQRMMLGCVTICHLADSKEELDNDSNVLMSIARSNMCELQPLAFSCRQLDGLSTVLPVGVNKLNIVRTLITESASVFIPFRAQEIMDRKGIWFGQNAITNNLILCNKELLLNPNAFQLGVPGSGKSFLTKEQIIFIALSTDDDILICDPEGEYAPLVRELGGEVIQISAGSSTHINALDMEEGYGDSGNPVGDKSQFVMSLFEQLDRDGIKPIDRSIIDRCIALVFQDYYQTMKVPTLITLRKKLLEQPEPEARSLALKLELFTDGSLDVFAHETNVNVSSRIVSYDIFKLGKQLKTMGLLVITDAFINRVNSNWRKGKRTHVIVDEFHVVFENDESASFFNSAWRQFRKRDAFPIGITQNVEYLLDSVQASTMLSNSEFVVMLNQAYQDREKLAKLLNISDEQLSYITNAQSGCGLIKYGGNIVPFVNRFPKNTELYKLMTTKPADRKE